MPKPHKRQPMHNRSIPQQIKAARAEVCRHTFGTEAWEAAMVEVRRLCALDMATRPAEEFCSVDSGVHRTRLRDGRIV